MRLNEQEVIEIVFKSIVVLLIALVIFTYFPRSAATVLGVKQVNSADIEFIQIFINDFIQRSPEYYTETIMEDKERMDLILSNLPVEKKVRRKLLAPKSGTYFGPQVTIHIKFADHHQLQRISFAPPNRLGVNSTRYLFYGEDLDTRSFLELVRAER